MRRDPDLQVDQGNVVRDNVVQVSRNPHPFFDDAVSGLVLAHSFRLHRARLDGLQIGSARTDLGAGKTCHQQPSQQPQCLLQEIVPHSQEDRDEHQRADCARRCEEGPPAVTRAGNVVEAHHRCGTCAGIRRR